MEINSNLFSRWIGNKETSRFEGFLTKRPGSLLDMADTKNKLLYFE